MVDIFRKSSLEKLQNPEQLDRAIVISSPISWVALIGVALIIISALIWAIFGTIPTICTASGIVANSKNSCALYADESGTIENMLVSVGENFNSGDHIAEIKLPNGKKSFVSAKSSGTVSALLIDTESDEEMYMGDLRDVYPGSEIARYTPSISANQVVVCYVPFTSAAQIKKGMNVLVYPTSIDSQRYGHMEATIIEVGSYAASLGNMSFVLGPADNNLANQFSAQGPVVAVVCEIKSDLSTNSGFYWTSKKGIDLTVNNGSLVTAKIVVSESSPIEKLFNNIRDMVEE